MMPFLCIVVADCGELQGSRNDKKITEILNRKHACSAAGGLSAEPLRRAGLPQHVASLKPPTDDVGAGRVINNFLPPNH